MDEWERTKPLRIALFFFVALCYASFVIIDYVNQPPPPAPLILS